MSLQVKYAILTNKGLVRSINEDIIDAGTMDKVDTAGAPFRLHYMVACDGMGGMKAGETASSLASINVVDYIKSMPFWPSLEVDISDQLKGAVLSAHQNIKMLADYDFDKNGMGTTIVLLVIVRNIAYITWSGDSRAYLLTKQKNFKVGLEVDGLRLLTKDHAISWEMVEKGLLTVDQVRNHPQSNALTQSLGGEVPPSPEFISFSISDADRFLLCTDGVYLHMETSEIRDILINYNDPHKVVEAMEGLILSQGAKDNFSVGIIDVLGVQWSEPMLATTNDPLKNQSPKGYIWLYVFVLSLGFLIFWNFLDEGIFKGFTQGLNDEVSTTTKTLQKKQSISYNDSLMSALKSFNIEVEKLGLLTDSLLYDDTITTTLQDVLPMQSLKNVTSDPKTRQIPISKPTTTPSINKVAKNTQKDLKGSHTEKSILYDKLYNDVQSYLNGYRLAHSENDVYKQAYMIRIEQLLFEIKQKKQDNDYTNLTKTNWQVEYLKNKFDMIQSKYQPE